MHPEVEIQYGRYDVNGQRIDVTYMGSNTTKVYMPGLCEHAPVVKEVARRIGVDPTEVEQLIANRWHLRLLTRFASWCNSFMSPAKRWR